MNKQTKGAIAAGAAALLLAGGAGTMAAWNASEQVGGGSINSGTLSLEQTTTTGWTANGAAVDITNFLAVPGDVLVYTAGFEIGASGTNLEAQLVADTATISGDQALATALDPQVVVTLDGQPLAGGVITSGNDGDVVEAQVTFTFDPATAGTTAQNETIDLSNFSVSLTQQ